MKLLRLDEETLRKALIWIVDNREKLLISAIVLAVVTVALIYYNNNQKRRIAQYQVEFVQGFYGLQFGDTLNAPAILNRVFTNARGNRFGSYAGIMLSTYYYQLGLLDDALRYADASRKLDEVSKHTRSIMLSNIHLDKGNASKAVSLLKGNRFKSLSEFQMYRKARMLMAEGREEEAVKVLRKLVKEGKYFSGLAKADLEFLGHDIR